MGGGCFQILRRYSWDLKTQPLKNGVTLVIIAWVSPMSSEIHSGLLVENQFVCII